MAGRFLLQKLSSQLAGARSVSLFGTPASASVVAGASATRNASAARSFNTFPCSRVGTKTNCSTTSMPSIIINGLKPACVDSSGGAKGSFSSTASTRQEISRSAKMAAWVAEWDAKSAAWQARRAASQAEIERKIADFSKFLRIHVWLWGLAASCPVAGAFFEEENGTSFSLSKKENSTSFGNRQSGSCCCKRRMCFFEILSSNETRRPTRVF